MAAGDQTVTRWGVSFQYTVGWNIWRYRRDTLHVTRVPHRGALYRLGLAPRGRVFPNAGTLFTSPSWMQSGKSHLLSQLNVPIYTHSVYPKHSDLQAGTFGFIYIFRWDLMTHWVVRRAIPRCKCRGLVLANFCIFVPIREWGGEPSLSKHGYKGDFSVLCPIKLL